MVHSYGLPLEGDRKKKRKTEAHDQKIECVDIIK